MAEENNKQPVLHISPYNVNSTLRNSKEEQKLKNLLSENKEEEEIYGINLDFLFSDGALPIHYACLYNTLVFFTRTDLDVAHLDLPGGLYGSTPLMFTIYNSSYKSTLFLLLNGADLLLRNNRASDVLSVCTRFDNLYGLILCLSYAEGKLEVKRYLRYASFKNSYKVWTFLRRRQNEIEGKDEGIGEGKEEGKLLNKKKDNLAIFLGAITFLGIALFSPVFRLFISCCFMFAYIAFIPTPLPLGFNILYSLYAYYILLYATPPKFYHVIVVFMHLLLFLIITFMQNEYKSINKISEVKHIVTDLVLEDKYNKKNFCYTCLNKKEKGVKHCSVCDRCIVRHSHHCPFMNKCISRGMLPFFNMFIFLSVILYVLAICKSELKMAKFEFSVCFLISLASVVMLFLSIFSCYKKDRILMT